MEDISSISKNYYFKDLSFLISGTTSVDAFTVSDKIFGYSYAAHGPGMLVNVNFNELLLDCAEKYTSKFESTLSEDDKTDAYYFVNQLKDTLKAPFVARLSANETAPVLNSILINDGVTVTYEQLVSITLNMTGGLTHYKVGETADLTDVSWIAGTSKIFLMSFQPVMHLKRYMYRLRMIMERQKSNLPPSCILNVRPYLTQ